MAREPEIREPVFDLLEAVAKELEASGQRERGQALRAGFARGTGGVDLPYLVEQLVGAPRN